MPMKGHTNERCYW